MTDPVAPVPPAAPAYAPAGPKTNTLAIIALILGIVVPIGGIICGPIALGQIKRTGEAGAGLAKAGLIIGIIFTVIAVLFWIIYAVIFASVIAAGNSVY